MSDLLSAASLLMAVIAILYSLWYTELTKLLEIQPAKYKEDNSASRKQVYNTFYSKSLPLSIMAIIVAFVFCPDAVRICIESLAKYQLKGWSAIKDYDAVRTAYVLVFVFSSILASYICRLSWKIWRLLLKLGK
jgi:uncharacterized membrane protein YgcG